MKKTKDKTPKKYQQKLSLYGMTLDQVVDSALKYRPKDKKRKSLK